MTLKGMLIAMKRNDELKQIPRLMIVSLGDDGGTGFVQLDLKKPKNMACVVWSWGDGWDHVSVSYVNRCPTWEEMCAVKNMFFREDECCVQYHPAKKDYVNFHLYCLHMWRYQQEGAMPVPPTYMVGPREDQTIDDVLREVRFE